MLTKVEVSPNEGIYQQFLKRYKKARGIADIWAALHQACYYYAVPSKNRFWRPVQQQGDMRGSRIYDTTAIEATKTFVSKLHDAMTPPQQQWGYLDVDESFNALEEIEKTQIQQELANYMRKLFVYIHESNFDVVINECYFDLGVGTSCLVVNQYTDQQPLLFTSIPLDKLAIEEALNGRVETWFRTWDEVKISELRLRWKNAVLTPDMEHRLKDNPEATILKLYEGVLYMYGADKPYCYIVGDDSGPVLTEWYESNPGIVWRFQKINNEVFGRGPIMDALPSIISLNEMARIELAAANLNTFKPYLGFSDTIFNPFTTRIEPFTVIPIAPLSGDSRPPLIPLQDSSNPQFAQLTIMDLRQQIKTLLYNDVMASQSIQPQTAAEILVQQQAMAQRIGPLFARLQQEFLWPLIQRCAYILDKMGILPYPEHEGVKYQFRYKSPLALAKGMQDVQRFTQYHQLMQGMFGPETAMMYIDPGQAPYLIAEQMQVDMRYLNSPEQMQQLAQNLQNQQDSAAEDMAMTTGV